MRANVLRVPAICLVLGLGLLVERVSAACPADSVQSGTVCMDKYEASVWYVPATQGKLIARIRNGTVTLADLTSSGAVSAGVVQLGLGAGDLDAHGCPTTGNGCVDVYAVSIRGVTPAAFITWFQAAAAARNSHRRLPTNQEWQVAALGTPDTGGADDGSTTCNTDNLAPGATASGSRSACVSDVGAFDMVGNILEWVADWVPQSTACPGWGTGTFSDDQMCLAGARETSGPFTGPGAVHRGGSWEFFSGAGPFAVAGGSSPSDSGYSLGFRCAR